MITSVQDWFVAVASGNEDEIRSAMSSYVGTRDETGDTALIIAARMGEAEIVRLLSTTQEVGLINKEGCTALIAAAMSNKPSTCEILVNLEKHIPLKDGRDALMLAAFMMNYEAVSVLVKSMALVEDDNQMNALDYAVVGGSLKVVQAIAESQENIEDKLDYAIFLATEPVKQDILDYLKQFRGTSPSEQAQGCSPDHERMPLDASQQARLEDRLKQAIEERNAVADELTSLNSQLSTLFTLIYSLRKKRFAMGNSGSGMSSAVLTGKSSSLISAPGSDQISEQIVTLADAINELNIFIDLPLTYAFADDYEEIDDRIKQLGRAVSELQDLNARKDEEIAELKGAFETDIEGNLTEIIAQKDAKIEELQKKIEEQTVHIKDLKVELENNKAPMKDVLTLKAELKFKDTVINGLLSTIQKQERSFSAIRTAFQHKEVETQKYRTAISCSESTVKNLIVANDYERARFSARNSMVISSPVRLSGAWGGVLPDELASPQQMPANNTPHDSSIPNTTSSPVNFNPASIANISRLNTLTSPDSRPRSSLRTRSGRITMNEEERAELRKSIRLKIEENKLLKEALINAAPTDTETKVLREEIDRLKTLLRTSSPPQGE